VVLIIRWAKNATLAWSQTYVVTSYDMNYMDLKVSNTIGINLLQFDGYYVSFAMLCNFNG
jgi:hypothetical protein